MGLKIGQVAREAGVPIDTVRYYERVGIIPPPPRRPSGYRSYPTTTPRRVRFVKRAQELGFSLKEIGELLELRISDEASCGQVQEAAQRKIAEVDKKIARLQAIRAVLSELSAACPGAAPTSECPILRTLEDEAS